MVRAALDGPGNGASSSKRTSCAVLQRALRWWDQSDAWLTAAAAA